LFEPSNGMYVVGEFPYKIATLEKGSIFFYTHCTYNMFHKSMVPSQYKNILHTSIDTIGLAGQSCLVIILVNYL